jgi:hypothetical protein
MDRERVPEAALSPTGRSRLSGLVQAETVRLIEQAGPLDDAQAMSVSFHAHTRREDRIVERARLLGERYGLAQALHRWRASLPVAAVLAALLVGVVSWGICNAVVGADRSINAVAAFASVLGPHLVSLLVWLGALIVNAGARGSSAGFGLGRLAVAVSGRLVAGVHRASQSLRPDDASASSTRPADAPSLLSTKPAATLMPQALNNVLRRAGLLPWAFGLVSHVVWALAFLLVLLGLMAAFSFQAYRLTWETTILSPEFFVGFVRVTGWLPAQLGFAVPAAANVLSSTATAATAQAWAWWLIGCAFVYGLLPRLLLAGLSVAVLRAREKKLSLDLAEPGYRKLIARFEAMQASRVVDAEHRPEAAAAVVRDASDRVSTAAVIGFELPPETVWPPVGLSTDSAWSERIAGSGTERRTVLDRMARTRPCRIVFVCHALASPDRGAERFMRDACGFGALGGLLLIDGASTPAPDAAMAASRWHDWMAASGLSAVTLLPDVAAASRWLQSPSVEHTAPPPAPRHG